MTDEEVDKLSTPEERRAFNQYEHLQRQAKLNGFMSEGDLLLASQAIGILAVRNKRLGLIK